MFTLCNKNKIIGNQKLALNFESIVTKGLKNRVKNFYFIIFTQVRHESLNEPNCFCILKLCIRNINT